MHIIYTHVYIFAFPIAILYLAQAYLDVNHAQFFLKAYHVHTHIYTCSHIQLLSDLLHKINLQYIVIFCNYYMRVMHIVIISSTFKWLYHTFRYYINTLFAYLKFFDTQENITSLHCISIAKIFFLKALKCEITYQVIFINELMQYFIVKTYMVCASTLKLKIVSNL